MGQEGTQRVWLYESDLVPCTGCARRALHSSSLALGRLPAGFVAVLSEEFLVQFSAARPGEVGKREEAHEVLELRNAVRG